MIFGVNILRFVFPHERFAAEKKYFQGCDFTVVLKS